MAARIESLVAGFALHTRNLLVMVTDHLLLPFQRHVEVLASDKENIGPANNAPQGMGKHCNKATL
jgi:hypothetical protein